MQIFSHCSLFSFIAKFSIIFVFCHVKKARQGKARQGNMILRNDSVAVLQFSIESPTILAWHSNLITKQAKAEIQLITRYRNDWDKVIGRCLWSHSQRRKFYCLYLQGHFISRRRWQDVPPKLWYPSTKLHGVTLRKTVLFIQELSASESHMLSKKVYDTGFRCKVVI